MSKLTFLTFDVSGRRRHMRNKGPYRGTSLIKNSAPLGPYSSPMPRPLWRSWGGGRFLMSEVPL